jgi:hypothetical protein
VAITLKNTVQNTENSNGYRFTLRIEIQEKARSLHSFNAQQKLLPSSFDEIAHYKLRTEGEKESDFMAIASTTLNFIDPGKLRPF